MPSMVSCTKNSYRQENWWYSPLLAGIHCFFSLQHAFHHLFSLSFLKLKFSLFLQDIFQIMQQNSMLWPEACLNFGRVGCHSLAAAPSFIKDKKGILWPNGLFSFLFIWCAAGTEAFEVEGDGCKGRGRVQSGDNSRIEWGGTKISR